MRFVGSLRSTAARAGWVLVLMACSAGLLQARGQGPMGPMGAMGDHGGEGRGFVGRGGPSMGPPGRWWDDARVAQQLGLTADQRKKMDDTLSTHRLALIDDVAAVQKAEVVLEPLFAADQPNEAAILAQIGKVAEARAELEKAHARMLLALRAQLTHDQWVKLQAMRSSRHEGEGEGSDMRRGWRGEGGRMQPDGRGGPGPGGGPGGSQGPNQGPQGPNQGAGNGPGNGPGTGPGNGNGPGAGPGANP